jgi:hypothetical protein
VVDCRRLRRWRSGRLAHRDAVYAPASSRPSCLGLLPQRQRTAGLHRQTQNLWELPEVTTVAIRSSGCQRCSGCTNLFETLVPRVAPTGFAGCQKSAADRESGVWRLVLQATVAGDATDFCIRQQPGDAANYAARHRTCGSCRRLRRWRYGRSADRDAVYAPASSRPSCLGLLPQGSRGAKSQTVSTVECLEVRARSSANPCT